MRMRASYLALAVVLVGVLCLAPIVTAETQPTRFRVTNQCTYDIWIQQDSTHHTSDPVVVKLAKGGSPYDYDIPAAGLASTRFWAKAGCDSTGWNCGVGQSESGGGTTQTIFDSPIDSKFEATWGCLTSPCATNPSDGKPLGASTYWDASAVDGFTFAFQVLVKNDPSKSCLTQSAHPKLVTEINCQGLDPTKGCPHANLSSAGNFNPINGVDVTDVDLEYYGYTDFSKVVGCFSPCEILTSGQWLGWKDKLGGLTPYSDQAQMYCCPTSAGESWSVSEQQCNVSGKTIDGKQVPAVAPTMSYTTSIHEVCGVYAYAYDDGVGLVKCDGPVQYEMIFCPGGNSLPQVPPRVPEVFCDSTNSQSKCPGNVDCPATAAACGTNPTMCKCPTST